jgi:hypothetical protein
VVLFPAAVVADTGDAVKLKSFTATAKVVVRVWPAEAPVTVTV